MRRVFGPTGVIYVMLYPVRSIAEAGPPRYLPYTIRVCTRSHVSVVIAPSTATGPEAVHVPLTGHNLLFSISAGTGEDVIVERIGIGRTSQSALDAEGVSMVQPRFMPPLSADFVDPILRSIAAYEALKAPDQEIDLDSRTFRRLDDDVPSLPLRVPANQTATLVFAPVTDARDLVRWTLLADVSRAGRTERLAWEMTITAETFMSEFAGPDQGRWVPVHELFPDHWHRAASRQAIASEAASGSAVEMAIAHTSADGSAFLRRPLRDAEPEPNVAAKLRSCGDRHAARGRVDRARAAYVAAAEAGSAMAAYSLGSSADAMGDMDAALRWYTQAAELRFFPAFNDLAVLHHRRGELDQAEFWFRRGMDAGDWTAVAGLGALLWRRGAAEAEAVLRLVVGSPATSGAAAVIGDNLAYSDLRAAASAADVLAELLNEQGRTDEAVELWKLSAAHGNPRAAFQLGEFCRAHGDRAGAERWWRQSAEAGFQLSAYYLGWIFYEAGNVAEAEQWWRSAAASLEETLAAGVSSIPRGTGRSIMIGQLAESGEVRAAYDLGMTALAKGRTTKAEQWLTMAAQGGHPQAQSELAKEPRNLSRQTVPILAPWRTRPPAFHIDVTEQEQGRTAGNPEQTPEQTRETESHIAAPMPGAVRHGNWFVLLDPSWQASTRSTKAPSTVMVGGWMLDDEGKPGPFQPNPNYIPGNESTPTDPVDAMLRLFAEGKGEEVADRFVPTLCNTVVEIGCDERNQPLLGSAPDGLPCVLIVTAAMHKQRMTVDRWWPVLGSKLPEIVPVGADILINPGSSTQFRLLADALRRAEG